MWSENFQMFKLDLQKAEEPEIKLPTSAGSSIKQENFTKTSTFFFYWLHQRLWLCGSQQIVGNSQRDRNTLPASWEICIQVKKQQLELDMKQQTYPKLGNEYIEAVYCHPAYLTYADYIWNASLDEAQARINIAGRNINNLRMQMTPP